MNLCKILKAGHKTDVVVLDFSKAFDVVPHQLLLHKLDHYGIRGTTLNRIENFLTNRTQKVVVDGSSSQSARVRSGVPQGTVLGPLLFLTHINDLPSTVSSQVCLFADDCVLYRPIKSRVDQEQLQRDLSPSQDRANRWGQRSRVSWSTKSTSPSPLQPDTPTRRCYWSTNSKFKVQSRRLAILNLIRLKFFMVYPYLKLHVLLDSNGRAI